jgi:hypothetical protein
VAAIR